MSVFLTGNGNNPCKRNCWLTESALYYGNFIQTILDFIIISFFIFLAIRLLQRSKNKFEEVTNEIKSGLKKKKKLKKGEVVEEQIEISGENIPQEEIKEKELENEDIVTTEKSENNKIEKILSMTKMAEVTQKTKESQVKLLTEIRDFLKNTVLDCFFVNYIFIKNFFNILINQPISLKLLKVKIIKSATLIVFHNLSIPNIYIHRKNSFFTQSFRRNILIWSFTLIKIEVY